jgi:hypothetical protein
MVGTGTPEKTGLEVHMRLIVPSDWGVWQPLLPLRAARQIDLFVNRIVDAGWELQ